MRKSPSTTRAATQERINKITQKIRELLFQLCELKTSKGEVRHKDNLKVRPSTMGVFELNIRLKNGQPFSMKMKNVPEFSNRNTGAIFEDCMLTIRTRPTNEIEQGFSTTLFGSKNEQGAAFYEKGEEYSYSYLHYDTGQQPSKETQALTLKALRIGLQQLIIYKNSKPN